MHSTAGTRTQNLWHRAPENYSTISPFVKYSIISHFLPYSSTDIDRATCFVQLFVNSPLPFSTVHKSWDVMHLTCVLCLRLRKARKSRRMAAPHVVDAECYANGFISIHDRGGYEMEPIALLHFRKACLHFHFIERGLKSYCSMRCSVNNC
ncbi:hypothetical protein CEXT_316561 [Caerostris extrusa]|uniref:Uncharacterized protein n=1 Tax=Caerostris extrusa TaxID=172846 RepID=A0AAV4T3B7_CAEEX|nr:hypothetical protein CEXT_316561 [Caerostris extrusa]